MQTDLYAKHEASLKHFQDCDVMLLRNYSLITTIDAVLGEAVT